MPALSSIGHALRRLYLELRVRIDESVATRLNYDHVAIRIGGSYPELPIVRPPFPVRRAATPTLLQLLGLLDEIERDTRLRTVLVRIDPLHVGWSRVQTIARALDRIRSSGKQVVAYLERCGTSQYALAVHCDRIVVPPTATLNLTGLRAEVLFAKELLDRLEVSTEFEHAGKYKSAMEVFTRTDLSPAARENLESILDSHYADLVSRIAKGRGLAPDKVKQIIDNGPYLADNAKKADLVDELLYRHEAKAYLKEEKKVRSIRADLFGAIASRRRSLRTMRSGDSRIGVLVADGMIVAGRERPGADQRTVTVGTMRRCLRAMRKNDSVKAVVLRVNSPGGDGLASDLIHQELLRLAGQKPLVVSMGDTAASGGYYLAMAGSTVFAEPGTLTGSIGVIAGKVATRGLLAKAGLRKSVLTRGANADFSSSYRPLSPAGRKNLKEQIAAFYKTFVGKVAEARQMKVPEARRLAEGRVWTGEQAVENGLADGVGGLFEAIQTAKEKAGIDPAAEPWLEIQPWPKPWSWLRGEGVFGLLTGSRSGLLAELADDLADAATFADALGDGEPCALLPFRLWIR